LVAPETRRRVLEAIRELNYYKNASARLLVRGRSDTYGLIISDIGNPFFPELIKTFEEACLEQRLEILLCATNYDPDHARKAVRRMIESKVRAVAVMTSQLDPALVAELIANDTPVALLDSPLVGRGRSTVRIDYSRGARETIDHLYQLGHRRMALVTGPLNRTSAVTYKNTLLQMMAERLLAPSHMLEGKNGPEDGAAAVRDLLQQPTLPTAIVFGNDLMAIGGMTALSDAGLRVPDDISVVGADDILFARYSHPPLTTARIPRHSMGRMAFEALTRMLRTKRHLGVEMTVHTELVVRRTTAGCRP
jgi:LacI family transcriptional regulator